MRINLSDGANPIGSVRYLGTLTTPLDIETRIDLLYRDFYAIRENRRKPKEFAAFLVKNGETGEFEVLDTSDEMDWSM